MRLRILSDLHLERAPLRMTRLEADVTILAGDVARGAAGVRWAGEQISRGPVLYVAGNHEFYGHALPSLIDELREAAAGTSVRVLENDAVVRDGVRFLGCTLWSDFAFDGVERRECSMEVCARVVNDYRHIRYGAGHRTLRPADTLALHARSRDWLAGQLEVPFAGPTVVVTHHQPVLRTGPAAPRTALMRAVAGAFASDLTALMGADRVALWIYGHTHRWADLDVRGTRVLSNPRGYPGQPVGEFDPGLLVEL